MRRISRISLWRTPRTRALLLVGTLAILVAVTTLTAHIYTDVLWFGEVGQASVYWTTLKWKLLPPAVTGLGTTCAVLANLALVERRTGSNRRSLYALVAIACGLLSVELRPAGSWELLALYANREDFGVRDPVFHHDAGFFVFTLPLYQQVVRWLLELLLMAGAATVAAYALEGRLKEARSHLLGLGTFALLVVAWRLRLDQYALALPHAGSVVPGASYTDVHVRLPLLRLSVVLALTGAAVCAYAAVRPVRLAALAVTGVCAALAAAFAGGLPALVERLDVAPQALARERPYVAASIAATRRAFALDRVEVRSAGGSGELTARTLAEHRETLENVPLWDSSVLRPALNETHALGGYYSFGSTAVDRYRGRLTTVAARRLDLTHLAPASRTWANTHFAYTHGYGVVAVPGGEAGADGYPRIDQRDFDGGLTEPRIYFGERAPHDESYVVLNSARAEIEQPAPGSTPPAYHYDGTGGIALSNVFRRAAFAIRFADLELLLTETVGEDSRIAVRRDARERVTTLAPFLEWDTKPQTVVAGGRVYFLFHGYTTSSHFPYAARVGDDNYLRASALAVVDAFDGRVTLYAADRGDPILRAWSGAYPGLFADGATLPASLRSHLRYPRRLFAAQSEVYETYHADDATAFWNGADAWQRASDLAGPVEEAGEIQFPDPDAERVARPAYLLVDNRLLLTTAFTPRGRENLAGYLAGSVDGLTPRLTLLSLPRDRLVTGPTQATRQILADPAVGRTLEVLNRESRDLGRTSINRVVLGTARIVPIGDALVHVQPVYITAAGSGYPRLQLVTAHANGRVGYGGDVRGALRRTLDATP